MGHHHQHAYDPKHDHGHAPGHGSRRALIVAVALTAGFMVVELVVGLWADSLALVADAGHMLNDSMALGLSLFVSVIASKPRTRRHTYGYRRAEVMGALVNAVMLGAAGALVIWEAIGRIGAPPEVRGVGMLTAAGVGLGVNLLVAFILSRHTKDSLNVKAAFFHVLGDILGSVAAIVAGVLILTLGWNLADPVASLIIATLILVGAFKLLRETVRVLMAGAPPGVDVEALERTIRETPGVADMHDLHVWCLVPDTPLLSAHVVLSNGAHGTDVARIVSARIAQEHGIPHCTIQPEAPEHPLVELRIKAAPGP